MDAISHSNCKYIIVVDLVIGFTEYRTCYLTWVCILDIYGTIYFDSGGHVFSQKEIYYEL